MKYFSKIISIIAMLLTAYLALMGFNGDLNHFQAGLGWATVSIVNLINLILR